MDSLIHVTLDSHGGEQEQEDEEQEDEELYKEFYEALRCPCCNVEVADE